MESQFDYFGIIRSLISFSPRQAEGEKVAAQYLKQWLISQNISFQIQPFTTQLPEVEKTELKLDGKLISHEASCFVSGEITGKQHLLSSLTSSQPFLYEPNINFNPECEVLSLSNFYFAPAVAIAKEQVGEVLAAKKVEGNISVRPREHLSENILVGNSLNPKVIIIAHYDSIKCGATDNASGVVVLLALLERYPQSLDSTLYVLSGNEELSYDQPIYWGHGFRVFEEAYEAQLKGVEKILVVDCVGNGPVQIDQDSRIMKLAFPLSNLPLVADKVYLVSGDIERLMTVYHSEADTLEELEEHFLEETVKKIKVMLNF